MKHLHFRVAATVDVRFEHISEQFSRANLLPNLHEKKMLEPHIHGGSHTEMQMFHFYFQQNSEFILPSAPHLPMNAIVDC